MSDYFIIGSLVKLMVKCMSKPEILWREIQMDQNSSIQLQAQVKFGNVCA